MKRFLSIILMVVAFAAASCNNYDEQIAQLQQQLDKLTAEKGNLSDAITSLSTLVAQLEKGSKVAVFTPVTNDAGKVTGYSVKFENGETVTLYNQVCNVGVGEQNGTYYWMVDGKFLEKDGEKVPIIDNTPAPQFKIDDGVLKMSLDGGAQWSDVGSVGKPCLEQVTEDNAAVTFTLAGGATIVLPKVQPLSITVTNSNINAGGKCNISYEVTGADENTSVFAYGPANWTCTVKPASSSQGVIEVYAPALDNDVKYEVIVLVTDGKGRTSVVASTLTGKEDAIIECLSSTGTVAAAVVPAKGGPVDIKVRTNVTYNVEIEGDWLKHTATKTPHIEYLTFTAEPNPDNLPRTANISLDQDSFVCEFKIIQEAAATDEPEVPEVIENKLPVLAYNALSSANATVENYRKMYEAGVTIAAAAFANKGMQKGDRYFSDGFTVPGIEKTKAAFDNAQQAGIKMILTVQDYYYNHPVGSSEFGVGHIDKDGKQYSLQEIINMYKDHPALWGYQICDEPYTEEHMTKAKEVMDEISRYDPNHQFYTALLAISGWYTPDYGGSWYSHEDYLKAWCDTQGKYASFINTDCYPIRYRTTPGSYTLTREWEEGDEEYILERWYEGLEYGTRVAKQRGIDFWGFLCTSQYSMEPARPCYAAILIEAYTILAYGAKGLALFTYEAWNNDVFASPVMEDGTHTDVYYALKEVLRSVQARADIFLHSDVKWVRHTTGTNKRAKKWWRTNEVPAANERFRTSDLGSDPITDLSTDITALVSRFSSNGDEYLMVVSKDHTETFDLEFTNTKKIYSVDKKGQLGAITPGDHTLTIDKGDCVIFKLND